MFKKGTVIKSSDISTLLSSDLEAKADKTLTLTAGNGLSGGGTLQANRTFTLGTPSTITTTSTNSVSATTHTHALSLPIASTSVSGIVQLVNATNNTSTTQAATANAVKMANDNANSKISKMGGETLNGSLTMNGDLTFAADKGTVIKDKNTTATYRLVVVNGEPMLEVVSL